MDDSEKNEMTKAEILEVVKKTILEVLPDLDPQEITPQRSLAELGANSVDRMEVLTMTMESLGISLPLLGFAKAGTIDGITDVLYAGTRATVG